MNLPMIGNDVYVAAVPLRAASGPPQLVMSAAYSLYVSWDLQHFMVLTTPASATLNSQIRTRPILGDDPIACLNKAMAFLTVVASSRFPYTNNQLRSFSNTRNQATIQDDRVTVQQVQGRQGQNYSGTTYKGNATSSRRNTTSGHAKVVKCYNCQGEGHMAKQCTQPKRQRNAAWYKEKAMLAEAQEAGQILNEEQLAFLTDPGILAEVPNSETYPNDMDNQSVHALQDFKQSLVMDFTDNEISSDSNNILYSQYLPETQQATEKTNKEQNKESITSELERYKERVKTFEQRLNIDLSCREKMIDSQMDDMIKEKLALKEMVSVFDFQPQDPESISAALAALSGRKIPGVVQTRKLKKLPKTRCWMIGSCNMDVADKIHKFNSNWDTDLIVGQHDCRHYTNGLVECLTGEKYVLDRLKISQNSIS
nr:hypothetical protein [Tanacetum cinerariifolium]